MTLGQVLKSKRLELGRSIEQIATATRIHVKVLKALEADEYSELPARAFTRGFIIAYCKAIHLNSDDVLRDYHDFLESKFKERPEKDHGHQGYAFEGKENDLNRRRLLIIAGGAAFFAILTLLFFKPQNHKHKEKHKELIAEEAEIGAAEALASPSPAIAGSPSPVMVGVNASSSTPSSPTTIAALSSASPSPVPAETQKASATPIAKTTPTAVPTTAPTVAPTAAPSASPAAVAQSTPKEDPLNKGDDLVKGAKIRISIHALEDTLIHYHSDQRKVFSIMLRKGKELVIKGNESVKVETSTPDHLKYKLNIKGKPGQDYTEMKEPRLELNPDGSESPFDAGSL